MLGMIPFSNQYFEWGRCEVCDLCPDFVRQIPKISYFKSLDSVVPFSYPSAPDTKKGGLLLTIQKSNDQFNPPQSGYNSPPKKY